MECKICQKWLGNFSNIWYLFIHNCLKSDDRSAESIDKFWSIDRELIKQEALLLQQCVMSYLKPNLKPNPLLFSDTLL